MSEKPKLSIEEVISYEEAWQKLKTQVPKEEKVENKDEVSL